MPSGNRQWIGAVPLVGALMVTFASAVARGQATAPAVGARVVVRPGAVLKVGSRVVDSGGVHRRYTVERVQGDWLWLTAGAHSGWARADDVMSLDRALGLYSDTIKADPNAAWAYYNRGLTWHDRRDLDRAIADYSQALRIDPGYAAALVNRGNAWQAKGDLDRAIADYSHAIRLEPGFALAYNNRGHARERKGDLDRAIADYSQAIRLSPGDQRSWLNRGNAWKAKGEPAKAQADLDRAKSLAAGTPAPGGAAVAQISRSPSPRGTTSSARPSIVSTGGYPAGITFGTTSGAGTGIDRILSPQGNSLKADRRPAYFYGANYVLPPTGDTPAVLPQGGRTNIGYRSSVPTYYGGNVPTSVSGSPVQPVDPASYGANYSGKLLTTPGVPPGPPSFYGANYSGTVTFSPGATSGYYPTSPSGPSFYGADYSGVSTFVPGSAPAGNPGSGGFAPTPP